MSDLIDRQNAIDALKKIIFTHLFECGEYIGEDTREFSIMNAEKALDVIENLPSAEPKRTERIIKIGQRSGKTLESAINYLQSTGWLQEHDRNLMESAEPKRKKGKWLDGNGIDTFIHCSVCYEEAYWDSDYGQQKFDFCPHCGADMRGE